MHSCLFMSLSNSNQPLPTRDICKRYILLSRMLSYSGIGKSRGYEPRLFRPIQTKRSAIYHLTQQVQILHMIIIPMFRGTYIWRQKKQSVTYGQTDRQTIRQTHDGQNDPLMALY